jgi:hypothetical protein
LKPWADGFQIYHKGGKYAYFLLPEGNSNSLEQPVCSKGQLSERRVQKDARCRARKFPARLPAHFNQVSLCGHAAVNEMLYQIHSGNSDKSLILSNSYVIEKLILFMCQAMILNSGCFKNMLMP